MNPVVILVLCAALLTVPVPAAAQSEDTGAAVALARKVLLDPTTYAPAVISYVAMRQDWKTSQPLFMNGWLEGNPAFTLSGRPADVPIDYGAGERKIRRIAAVIMVESLANNVAAGFAERMLIQRFPNRRGLIQTLSWVERIGFAAILTYRNSADHFSQAATNRRLANDYGYTTSGRMSGESR